MILFFSATFYPDGVPGRAHDDGGHNYANDNHLQLSPCVQGKASWQKPARRLLEERDILCNQQEKRKINHWGELVEQQSRVVLTPPLRLL